MSRDQHALAEVRAEMVATVLQVVTSVGAAVVAGQTMLVLESMKMEIPVLAEVGGTVVGLPVPVGALVLLSL